MPPAGQVPARSASHFRPDIEGLRGIAILLVVMFHAAPGLLGGGYIGVDVFFVISGFLITGLLMRELERTGRTDLATFYVRRVRRLLPAAALAIGVTLLLSALVIAPLELPRVAGDGVSAALSFANIRFAIAGGDYFTAVESLSPFLHYWSLAVEEQFYLVWPALLLVAFRFGRGPRAVAIIVALVALASLSLALVLSDTDANWAFYSLPARAWQLALGGLLAIAAISRPGVTRHPGVLAVVGWLGLAAVALAGIAFDAQLAYPGIWALLPTLGAVAIIAGGDRRFGPGLILRSRPVRFLGRISYALYLWHWPLLVLPAIAFGADLPAVARAGLVVLAVIIATASTLFIEEPIRRAPIGASRRRQVAVAGTLAMVLLLSVTAGVGITAWVTQAAIEESRQATAALPDPGGASSRQEGPADAIVEIGAALDRDDLDHEGEGRGEEVAPRSPSPRPTPRARATDVDTPTQAPVKPRPTQKPQPDATPRPTRKPRPTPTPTPRPVVRLPADVRPSVWEAPDDEEILRQNGCLEAEQNVVPRTCEFGDRSSKFVVALVGDSHASHWFPALNKVAQDRNWRLVTFVKVSCPFADMPVRNLRLKRVYRECARYNDNAVAALGRIKPDLVITALFRWQYPTESADESDAAQGAAVARMLDRVPGRKVVIADVPFPSHDVPVCLSKNLKDVRRCAVASYRRTSGGSPARERIAADRSGGALIDFGSVICGRAGDCPVVSNDMIMYRDTHHLTATYSRWLAPALDRALQKVIRSRR